MSIGLFPYISLVSWLVFVPSPVWERGRHLLSGTARSGPDGAADGSSRQPLRSSRPARALAAFFLVYVVLWNLHGLEATSSYVRQIFPWQAALVGHLLRLDQRWAMFSPSPTCKDGRLVRHTRNAEGRQPGQFVDGPARSELGETPERPGAVSQRPVVEIHGKYLSGTTTARRRARRVCRLCVSGLERSAPRAGSGLRRFRLFTCRKQPCPIINRSRRRKSWLWTHSCAE